VAESDLFRLTLPVPESAVPLIRLGSRVSVHVPALDRDFEGKVARFSDALSEETRTMHTSAALAAKAEDQNAMATREQVRLAVDQAFYGALAARSLTRVAEQTVSARQALADQIQALFQSKLKSQFGSQLCPSQFVQAKLLLLDAQNNENAALATLSEVLGYSRLETFQLVEDQTPLSAPPAQIDDLISQAFMKRPELLALDFEYPSARKFEAAEHDLLFPSIWAAGAVGDTPVRNPALSNWYGAMGVNIDVPLLRGFFTSRGLAKLICGGRLQKNACARCATGSREMFAPVG
jgi:outer membrane protein